MGTSEYIITGSAAIVVIFVVWYYLRNKHKPPALYYVDSDLHRYILKSRKRFTSPYRPPFWLQNNHLQTVIKSFLPKTKMNFKREYLKLADGGVLALDWVMDNEDSVTKTSAVLLVLPTLTGGREDMADLCKLAIDRGYRVVVFNKRGHGDSELLTPKLQGMGDTVDMRQCVEYVTEKFPLAKIVAVGSSAGSGLLASYLGDYGTECILTTGVCICPGYDLLELFCKHLSGLYEYILLSSLKKLLQRHAKVLAPVIDLKAACGANKFTEFDFHVYCKIYGYRDITEYWKHQNPIRNVSNVAVPALCINSLDDPVSLAQNIKFQMFQEKTDLMLAATDKGGHCGFLEADLKSWSYKISLDYIDAVLEYQTKES